MQLILSNPTERDLIRKRRDAEIDWRTMVSAEKAKARREGREEGKLEGKIEGKIEGREEGIIEGKEKNSIEIAKRMKAKGFPIDVIAEMTGLTQQEITAL